MTRDPSTMTTLNREDRRRMGLTTGGLLELFEQAQTQSAEEGCDCGIERIEPRPTDQANRHYAVAVYHAPSCPMHPVQVRKAYDAEQRKLVNRVKRLLRRH